MSKEIVALNLQQFYKNNVAPTEVDLPNQVDPNNPFIKASDIKSEYQPMTEVQTIMDDIIFFLASLQADNLLSSFNPEWYKNLNFSPKLIAYLDRININRRIWRLRFNSAYDKEGFFVPFMSPDDNAKLQWLDLSSKNKLWATRLIDDYKGISFYFQPIKEFYQQTFVISFFENTILYINLNYEGTKPLLGKEIPLVDSDFSFYEAIITRQKQDTQGDIWLINWPNDPHYKSDWEYCKTSIRQYAEAQFQGLNDLQLSGNRNFKFYTDKGLKDKEEAKVRNYKARNQRIVYLTADQQLTNPAQIGDTTFISNASNIENNLIYKKESWKEISNRLSLYNDGVGKGGTNQHSLEILLQNRKAIALNTKKLGELNVLMVKAINIMITLLKLPDKPLVSNTVLFKYELQIFEIASALAKTNVNSN